MMTLPTLDELFSRNGRIAMVQYILIIIVGLFLVLFLLLLRQWMIYMLQWLISLPLFVAQLFTAIPFFFLIAAFIGAITCWAIRRLHDFSQSGRRCLMLLIPLINIIFLIGIAFIPSTPWPNEYGPALTTS
jgi:uncharacterized membrane protein YhaH (DUF805 family)